MKALLLLNLGTPSEPTAKAVKSYLKEFLLDPRVLDINPLLRNFLVRFMIAPRRSKPLSKIYQSIWTDKGSPLLKHMLEAQNKLTAALQDNWVVEIGMCYQLPSVKQALERLSQQPLEELVILPLFPQYASATTGAVLEKTLSYIQKWTTIPKLQIITEFCDHPGFIQCHMQNINSTKPFERLIVSFHSLPERQLTHTNCLKCTNCCDQHIQCYRAHCVRTYKALCKALPGVDTVLTFQSRFGKEPWIGPETIKIAKQLAQDGVKSIAIVSPSFTMDCIETLYELEHEVKEVFLKAGGVECTVLPSLNSMPLWIDTLKNIALDATPARVG